MNFSKISNKNPIGKLLRFFLRLIPGNAVLPIVQGALRGKKWVIGSSNYGCWLGSFEYDKHKLFAETINEGSVVYDIGAHVGFYTLLASSKVGQKGKVFAFEPLHRNVIYLKEHLRLNRIDNVEVFEVAVAEQGGSGFFEERVSNAEGQLSPDGNLRVRMVALDALVLNDGIPPPDYIKIDVEGAELLVLLGARETMLKYHPAIFLATHGTEIHRQCCDFLVSTGYHLKPIGRGKDIYNTDEILACRGRNGKERG